MRDLDRAAVLIYVFGVLAFARMRLIYDWRIFPYNLLFVFLKSGIPFAFYLVIVALFDFLSICVNFMYFLPLSNSRYFVSHAQRGPVSLVFHICLALLFRVEGYTCVREPCNSFSSPQFAHRCVLNDT